MRRIPFFSFPFVLAATLVAQPRLTLDYAAIAKRLVEQRAVRAGVGVLSNTHTGAIDATGPNIRYEVMRAGAVAAGVAAVLRAPVPEAFDAAVLRKGAGESRSYYKA